MTLSGFGETRLAETLDVLETLRERFAAVPNTQGDARSVADVLDLLRSDVPGVSQIVVDAMNAPWRQSFGKEHG